MTHVVQVVAGLHGARELRRLIVDVRSLLSAVATKRKRQLALLGQIAECDCADRCYSRFACELCKRALVRLPNPFSLPRAS